MDQNFHHILPANEIDHHEGYGTGEGPSPVEATGPDSAPVDNTVYPVDNGTGEDLAPVEQPVFVDVQDAVLDVPLAEPEDAREPVPLDPLAASPLLATLGFERVQHAYERWLVNMSHAVSLYQGEFSQL